MPDSPFRIFPPLSGRFASSSLPPFLPPIPSSLSSFLQPQISDTLLFQLSGRRTADSSIPPKTRLPLFRTPTGKNTPARKHSDRASPPPQPRTLSPNPAALSRSPAPKTPRPRRASRLPRLRRNSARIHAQNKGPELHSSGPPTFKQSNYNETKEFPSFTESRRVHRHGKRPVPATGRTVGFAARDPNRKPFE